MAGEHFRRRFLTPATPSSACGRICAAIARLCPMPDLIWLAVLAGLFLLTLAFVRLCDQA